LKRLLKNERGNTQGGDSLDRFAKLLEDFEKVLKALEEGLNKAKQIKNAQDYAIYRICET